MKKKSWINFGTDCGHGLSILPHRLIWPTNQEDNGKYTVGGRDGVGKSVLKTF